MSVFLLFLPNKFTYLPHQDGGRGDGKGRREQGDDVRKQGVGKNGGRGDRETRLKEEKEWRKHRERNFTKIKCTYVYVGR